MQSKRNASRRQVHAIEFNRSLSDILSAKGHEVEFADFLEHHECYDRIVMNPPFENGQDIEHVQHAYSLLRSNGRLVSVMSEGPFFRSDQQSVAFRDWLDDRGARRNNFPTMHSGDKTRFGKQGYAHGSSRSTRRNMSRSPERAFPSGGGDD